VPSLKHRKISGMALLIVALLSVFWCVLGLPILIGAYDYDFLCYYIGGTLVREGHLPELYQPAAQRQVQDRVAPGLEEPRPYARPPWFAFAIAPLTRLPLVKAYAVWVALWLAVLAATWVWGARRFGEGALLLAALFLPTNLGFAYGQDCAGMLAVCCCAWVLFERRKLFAGGLVLGLALMKFHLLALVPVWLILQRRWRMLIGFIATGALFLLVSLEMLGVAGLQRYVHFLLYGDTELLGHSPDSMINIYGLLLNLGVESKVADGLMAAMVIGVSIFGIVGTPAWRALAIALTGSLLISPHVFAYDAAILLLPVWLVIENSKRKVSRWSALLLVNPVTFYFTAAHPPWRCVPAVMMLVFLVVMVTDRTGEAAPTIELEQASADALTPPALLPQVP
jgi:hypothetical protein